MKTVEEKLTGCILLDHNITINGEDKCTILLDDAFDIITEALRLQREECANNFWDNEGKSKTLGNNYNLILNAPQPKFKE